MDIFQKNLKAIDANYTTLSHEIRKISLEQATKRIGVRETSLGNEILVMEKEGRQWNLNSRLDPDTVATIYAEVCQIKKFGIYIIFGFMDGRHIRSIVQKCDDTNKIVVCVPDIEVFYMACHRFDLTDLIADKRIWILAPEINKNIENFISEFIDYTNSKLVDFLILPGQDVLYSETCEIFIDQVIEVMRNIIVMKNTRESFDRKIPRHTLFHMKNMVKHSNHAQLKHRLEDAGVLDVPAIIVSAGPSLDKNVKELKKAQGKSFIIVVDAALRTVIKEGIRPDLVCTLDPNTPNRFYENVDLSQIIWSCTSCTRPDVVSKHGKKIFYYGYFGKYWGKELEKMAGYDCPDVISGGCVSIEAFMLARYLGFKKVVLIGQDLAFTGGVSHTKGIAGVLGENDEYIKSRYLMEVEGIDGTILNTDFQMWYYKQWFEKAFKKYHDEIEVIDATEGGALIQGTKLRSLKEVIQKECTRIVNIYELAVAIPPMFSQDEQKKMLQKLKAMKEMVEELIERVENDIERQKQILRMLRQKNINSKILASELQQLMHRSERLRQEQMIEMAIQYATEAEYKFGDDIYAKEDMSVKELVQQSIQLHEGYLNGCKMLLEDIEEIIIKE